MTNNDNYSNSSVSDNNDDDYNNDNNNSDNGNNNDNMRHTIENLRNPFTDLYHWVKGELYDMAALDIIVREAGGRFTSLAGTDGPFGGNALASNGHLHEAALSFLGTSGEETDDPDARRAAPGSVSDRRSHRERAAVLRDGAEEPPSD